MIQARASLVLFLALPVLLAVPRDSEPAAPAFAQDPGAAAPSWQIDPGHSFSFFSITHQGVGLAYGRFNEFSGTIQYDPENLAGSSVAVLVKADSIDTNSEGRDKHLRSPDFLNTKQFPEIEFTSSKVEADGAEHLKVTGTLALHGKEKEVVARVRKIGAAEGRRGRKIGFEAEMKFNRMDFGVDYMPDGLGHEITLRFAVEAVAR